MSKKTIRTIFEIVFVALIVISIFIMGKMRVHQLHIDIFFPIGFAIILALLIAYSVMFRLTEEDSEHPEENE